jgi:uncharacterized protein (DUF433 family)
MRLEDHFTFLAPDDIRIKGSRIGVESVLYEYVHNARSPEEIREQFPSLSLAQVYATILYYLENKERVSAYLADYLEYCREADETYRKNPPAAVIRLRRIKEQLAAYPPEERAEALQRILAAEKAERQVAAQVP